MKSSLLKCRYRAMLSGIILVMAGLSVVGVYAGWIDENLIYAVPFTPVRTIVTGILFSGWMLEYTYRVAPIFPVTVATAGFLFIFTSIGGYVREMRSENGICRC